MSNLAIPFSLSDILERVIPGGLLILAAALGFHPLLSAYSQIATSPLAYVAFLTGSYALGVSVNSVAGFLEIKGYRQYWSDNPSAMEVAVRHSIETHFGLVADDRTWRLCYGTVIKQGYGANTQLFLGLDVFCRAMAVVSILAGILFLVSSGLALYSGTSIGLPTLCMVGSFCFAFLFERGAKIYSQAFVGSIYEGFFNWRCDSRGGHAGSDSEQV